MIEILVYTKDEGKDSILKLRRSKGFPVVAKLSPCFWGGAETLPDFIRVVITDTDDLTEWTDGYIRKTSYSILEHNPMVDFFRVKIFPQDKYPVCQITLAEMQQFLLDWGAEKVENDAEDLGVIFELTAMDAINHRGLFTFGEEDAFVKYNEVSYVMSTGEHQVMLDYSLSKLTEEDVRRVLTNAHFIVDTVDHTQGICLFTGYRHIMIGMLESQVEANFHKLLFRSQWRFNDNTVDTAIQNNGVIEMTLEESNINMIDIVSEV